MTKEEALRKVKGYLTDYIPADNYKEVEEIVEALEQEPCEDTISRQEVLYLIADYDLSMGQVVKGIHALPSVAPQQKIGHWIEQIDHEENCRTLICSNCDRPALHDGDSIWKHKFCPHCGAKMAEIVEQRWQKVRIRNDKEVQPNKLSVSAGGI